MIKQLGEVVLLVIAMFVFAISLFVHVVVSEVAYFNPWRKKK